MLWIPSPNRIRTYHPSLGLDIAWSEFQFILFHYRNAFTKFILILSMFSFLCFFSALVRTKSFFSLLLLLLLPLSWFEISFFLLFSNIYNIRAVFFSSPKSKKGKKTPKLLTNRTCTQYETKNKCKHTAFCFVPFTTPIRISSIIYLSIRHMRLWLAKQIASSFSCGTTEVTHTDRCEFFLLILRKVWENHVERTDTVHYTLHSHTGTQRTKYVFW